MGSAQHTYFTMIPNLVDDLGLDPYTHRLYCHIKRVTGENGACWQSTETLATHCCMSKGKVSDGKRRLVAANLIRITKRVDHGRTYDVIRCVDRWAENDALFSGEGGDDEVKTPARAGGGRACLRHKAGGRDAQVTRSPDDRVSTRSREARSRGERTPSPGERTGSSGEPKKTHIKKKDQQDPKEDLDSYLSPPPPEVASPPPEAAVWDVVLEGLQGMMMRGTYETWYMGARFVGVDDDGAWRIAVPAPHMQERLSEHPGCRALLRRALRYAGVGGVTLRFVAR